MERSALALELQSNRLTHCYYLRLYCAQHGKFRAAADHAGQCYPCLICDVPCDCTVLCEGGTSRHLPFWDLIHGPVDLSSLSSNVMVSRLHFHVTRVRDKGSRKARTAYSLIVFD